MECLLFLRSARLLESFGPLHSADSKVSAFKCFWQASGAQPAGSRTTAPVEEGGIVRAATAATAATNSHFQWPRFSMSSLAF